MTSYNGTQYDGAHSISFGKLVTRNISGTLYTDFEVEANTWNDWHLIPTSRPSIAHPNPNIVEVQIPGSEEVIDLTQYLTGRMTYGQRSGTISFRVDNDHEDWETIRSKMVRTLHGKKLKFILDDDPGYYYEGYITVGQWKSEEKGSSIDIGYKINPYKMSIAEYGSTPMIWDTFCFETDYDYSVLFTDLLVNNETKYFNVYAGDYPFSLTVVGVTGGVTVSMGGVSVTPSRGMTEYVGYSSPGLNRVIVSGTGSVKITWRNGSL